MKVNESKKFKQRGIDDFEAGKKFTDNPFLHIPNPAKSSWWQAGWLIAKREQERRNA